MKKTKQTARPSDSDSMTSSASRGGDVDCCSNSDTRATNANSSTEDLDAEAFVASCQDWVKPELPGGSFLRGELSWLKRRRGRWLGVTRCSFWPFLGAIFGINFHHTKRGMVWHGARIGVASNSELSDCHAQLARLWAKRKSLEQSRERVQNEMSQIWKKLRTIEESEEKLCQRAVKALEACSPSFRAAVEWRQKIENENEQQRITLRATRRELPEAQVGDDEQPALQPRGLGEAIRQRVRQLQQHIPNEDDPELLSEEIAGE